MASETLLNAEEIQRQMQSVRSSLRADVKELVDNARDMTNWKYYVRRYPLASVAVAAAAGFLATSFGAQAAASANAATPQAPLSDAVQPPLRTASSSFVGDLFSFCTKTATTALTRAALTLASQQLSKFVDGHHFAAPDATRKENPADVQSHF